MIQVIKKTIKFHMKSKFTIFILLAHIAIFVVNNSFKQVNPQKIVCLHNL